MVGEYGKYAEGLLVESLKLLRDLQLTEASGLCCLLYFSSALASPVHGTFFCQTVYANLPGEKRRLINIRIFLQIVFFSKVKILLEGCEGV